MYLLGGFYLNGIAIEEDDYEAFKWYKSAELDYLDAMEFLGQCYLNGYELMLIKNCRQWFEKSNLGTQISNQYWTSI